jgi:hypothetical protein
MIAQIQEIGDSGQRRRQEQTEGNELVIRFLCAWKDRIRVMYRLLTSDVVSRELQQRVIPISVRFEPWIDDVSPKEHQKMIEGLDCSDGIACVAVKYKIME